MSNIVEVLAEIEESDVSFVSVSSVEPVQVNAEPPSAEVDSLALQTRPIVVDEFWSKFRQENVVDKTDKNHSVKDHLTFDPADMTSLMDREVMCFADRVSPVTITLLCFRYVLEKVHFIPLNAFFPVRFITGLAKSGNQVVGFKYDIQFHGSFLPAYRSS